MLVMIVIFAVTATTIDDPYDSLRLLLGCQGRVARRFYSRYKIVITWMVSLIWQKKTLTCQYKTVQISKLSNLKAWPNDLGTITVVSKTAPRYSLPPSPSLSIYIYIICWKHLKLELLRNAFYRRLNHTSLEPIHRFIICLYQRCMKGDG